MTKKMAIRQFVRNPIIGTVMCLLATAAVFYTENTTSADDISACGIPVLYWLKVNFLSSAGMQLLQLYFLVKFVNLAVSNIFSAQSVMKQMTAMSFMFMTFLLGWSIYGLTLFYDLKNTCYTSELYGWYIAFCIFTWCLPVTLGLALLFCLCGLCVTLVKQRLRIRARMQAHDNFNQSD